MSDGESSTPAPRRRPTYGLPGPTGQPSGHGAPFGDDPVTALPASPPPSPEGPGSGRASRTGGAARRRGVLPLVLGLVLLVVIAPLAVVIGLVWGFGSLVGDTAQGPTVFDAGGEQIELSANEMLIVYIPSEDAAGASCAPEDSAAVSSVPTSGSVEFPDGTSYEQSLGLLALEDTTVTLSCTGTEQPGYLGPYNVLQMAGPMLLGPAIGVVAGLAGLVLTIVGLVLLLRSRSAG